MIEELRIENLGVIEEATIEPAPGLTAITGETGAGKTMLLTGVNLILGGKADPTTVRVGQEHATAEARIVPATNHPAIHAATEAGADLDEDSIIIVRTIRSGRSRAYLGGRSVPQGVLTRVTADLVTVHGQSDQNRLRSPAHQREALDEFCGQQHQEQVRKLAKQYAVVQELQERLRHWDDQAKQREAEINDLEQALHRIEEANPTPGEQQQLREQSERLANIENLRMATATAHGVLRGDIETGTPGVVELLHNAIAALESGQPYDPQLGTWAGQIEETSHILDDLGTQISSYGTSLDAAPAQLEEIHQRRALLGELTADYCPDDSQDPDAALVEYAQWAHQRLAELTDPTQGRQALEDQLQQAEEKMMQLAQTISDTRLSAAQELEKVVNSELAELAMGGASLHVKLSPTQSITPTGREDVQFDLVANRGGAQVPLAKGASGGELSRVMLALEVALATKGNHPLPTFIFDEIDAGVGGKAATAIGRRLAQLAQHSQVIVVTHLAQVAAYADVHVVVTKTTTDGADAVTNSNITTVEGDDRIGELARMLSGDPDSNVARAHAAELISRQVVAR